MLNYCTQEFHTFQISIVVYIYMLYFVDVLLFILHFTNICNLTKTAPVEAVTLAVIACAHFKLLVSYILFAFY